MNFKEAQSVYRDYRSQLSAGEITPEQFQQHLEQLRLQAADGSWWQIRAADGAWLCWDGAAWVEADPEDRTGEPSGSVPGDIPAAPVKDIQPGSNAIPRMAAEELPSGSPGTLGELFLLILRGLGKSILKQLAPAIILFVGIWFLHTVIMVFLNDGWAKAGNQFLGMILVLKGGFIGGALFWLFFMGLLRAVPGRVRQGGMQKLLSDITSTPGSIYKAVERSGRSGLLLFLGAAAASLLVGFLLFAARPDFGLNYVPNRLLNLMISLSLLLALSEGTRSFIFLFGRLSWYDGQRLMNVQPVKPFDPAKLYILLGGVSAGFALVVILPFLPWSGYFAALALVVTFVILMAAKGGGVLTAGLMLLAGAAVLLAANQALAHDWGWQESGRDLGNLIRSAGFTRAFVHSVTAAIAAVIGALISAVAQGIPVSFENDPVKGLPAEAGGGGSIEAGGPDDNPFTRFNGGDGPAPCSPYGLPNYWVNTAALNMVVRDTVFASAGVGPAVDLTITYNSLAGPAGGMFGRGWRFSYEWLLELKDEKAVVHKGSGQSIPFTVTAVGSAAQPAELQPPAGLYHRLISYGEYWLFMDKGGRLYYRFDRSAGTNLARLTAISDLCGNAMQLGYDNRGNLASVSDAAGRMIHFSYNDANLCVSFALSDGRQAAYAYDTKGCLLQAVDLLGVVTEYSYDEDNCMTAMIVGRTRRTICFTYSRGGRRKLLESVTDANGCTTRYEMLSDRPRQVRVTDPKGAATVYQSSGGLTEAITGSLGHCVRFAYSNGMPVNCRDQNGQVTLWEYDRQGRLTAETDPAGNKAVFAYDDLGNLMQAADPLGGYWRYDYDQYSNLTKITTPAGRTLTMEYDSRGLLAASTAFNGGKTEYSRDRFGNTVLVKDPLGHTQAFSYDPQGYMLASVTDQLGQTTSYEYDANQRPARYIYPDGTENSMIYDCCFMIQATDENGRSIALERDLNGNVTRIHHTSFYSADFSYDCNGKLLSATSALGQATVYDYDEARRLTRVTDSLGQSSSFEYDPAGNLLSLKTPGDRCTLFEYDPCHRQVSTTDPLGSATLLQRDALGRVTALTNARGSRADFVYDPDGLLEKVLHEGEEAASYRYDTAGRLSELRDATGSTLFTYDAAGRIAQISYPGDLSLYYHYDAAGNISKMVYPGGLSVEYEYDCRKRVEKIHWGENWVKYEYDAAGNLIRELRSNGTESRYSYDPLEQIVELAHLRGDEPFVRRHYIRDAAGNILEETGFQPLAPPADNVFSITCNLSDQAVGEGPASFRYDADGNLVTAGVDWAAEYDIENRLTELTRDGLTIRCVYNGLGQRARITSQSGERCLGYDPAGSLLFETDEAGKVSRYFLCCNGRPAALVEPAGGSRFYHFDQAGNTLVLSGEDGSIAAAYAYSPFGTITSADSAGCSNPYTYGGAFGVVSEGDGLYFMKRRFYDARWGRFVQKDPLGISGGMNLYAYAANNPLKYIDPDGTLLVEAWLTWKAVGAVVGVVTVAVAGYKTVSSGYNTVQEFKKKNQAADQMREAFRNYANVVDDKNSTLAAREEAYQKYEQAYNKVVNAHNNMLNGAEDAVTGAVETGINAATPDYLNVPALLVTPGGSAKDSKCTRGAGGYFIRKQPRLAFHHVMNR